MLPWLADRPAASLITTGAFASISPGLLSRQSECGQHESEGRASGSPEHIYQGSWHSCAVATDARERVRACFGWAPIIRPESYHAAGASPKAGHGAHLGQQRIGAVREIELFSGGTFIPEARGAAAASPAGNPRRVRR
jgi:hypothetical protein